MLDTNICSYALKGDTHVLKHLLSLNPSSAFVSVISEGELRLGVAKSQLPEKTLRRVLAFLRPLTLMPFESEDSEVYAHVRARLEKAGTPIGPLD